MTAHVRDAGSWKEIQEIHVRDAGTWKDVQEGWVRDGGVWRQFFSAETVLLTNRTISAFAISPASATAGIRFNSDGTLQTRANAAYTSVSGEWLTPSGDGSAYRVRATLSSGPAPSSGPALSTWHALTVNIEWSKLRSGIGSDADTVLFIEIDKGDGVVIDSATITLQATVESA